MHRAWGGALFCLLSVASTCRADDSHPASASVTPAPLGEVLVTARRREERLLDVPDSITVLGRATLDNARITSAKDLALRVPNVSLVEAQQPGVSLLNVRGVCQAHNGEPPVAMVIDGVQLTHPYQITQALFDVERIEVLKGPQGAMYGRNAIGGAINITTRQPTDQLQAVLQAGVGSDSDYTAAAVLSGPIVLDKLLFRLATDFRDFDGDVASPNTPGRARANSLKERDARVTLIARPSQNTSIDLRVAHADTDSGGAWYAPVPPGQSGDVPRAYIGDVLARANRTLTDASLKADVRFERMQLTAVSAYSDVAAGLTGDVDFLPLDGSSGDQILRSETWSQELRLTSRGADRLRWLAGLYYLNKHQRLDTQIFLRTDFLPLFGLPSSLSPLLAAATRTSDNDEAYAAFGQLSYRWPSSFELTFALRYDEDHRHQLDRSAPVAAIYEHRFDALQPKVSLSWMPEPDRMVYATVGKGFRSGGFNPQARITRIYKAESSLSYELGFKGSLLEPPQRDERGFLHAHSRPSGVHARRHQLGADDFQSGAARARLRPRARPRDAPARCARCRRRVRAHAVPHRALRRNRVCRPAGRGRFHGQPAAADAGALVFRLRAVSAATFTQLRADSARRGARLRRRFLLGDRQRATPRFTAVRESAPHRRAHGVEIRGLPGERAR